MIECTKEIEVSQKEIFDLTQNYDLRTEWDPFPESYRFLNGNTVGKGLELEVVDKSGRSMIVEYVSFKPPIVAAVKMVKGPWYIRNFAGSWMFKDIGRNRTLAVFKYNISGFPSILSKPIRWVFSRDINKRLIALKKYAESKI